jgi:hypothetical protein
MIYANHGEFIISSVFSSLLLSRHTLASLVSSRSGKLAQARGVYELNCYVDKGLPGKVWVILIGSWMFGASKVRCRWTVATIIVFSSPLSHCSTTFFITEKIIIYWDLKLSMQPSEMKYNVLLKNLFYFENTLICLNMGGGDAGQ